MPNANLAGLPEADLHPAKPTGLTKVPPDMIMEPTFKAWKANRKLISGFFDNHTAEQLNHVPAGFNNNLIWNIGHIVVVQQALVYKSSGLEAYVSDALINRYKSGTKPADAVSADEMKELKSLLTTVIDKTIDDLGKGKFITYQERTTSTGFHLGSVVDAIEFNNWHEGLHLGYMMSLRKFV